MTKRIATAVVALALFVPVLYFAGTWVYPAVVALLGAVAVWEMLGCIGVRARLFLSLPSALLAVAAPLLARVCPGALYPLYLVYGLYLLFASVLFYSKTEFVTLAKTAFTMLFVTFGFASLVLVRDADPLRYLLIFVAAWSTDTFALFAGKLFGRRKLCEHISPKKTVAGAVGGVIGCIAAFAVYALVVGLLYDIWETWENYLLLALLAVCGSLVSMLGDLAASVIKRAFGVKDYGNIFPGHGGVLDRFDSILPLGIAAAASDDYFRANAQRIMATRETTTNALRQMGFSIPDSQANFLFITHPQVDGAKLYQACKDKGVLIRHFSTPALAPYNRVTIGSEEEMAAFLSVVEEILAEEGV